MRRQQSCRQTSLFARCCTRLESTSRKAWFLNHQLDFPTQHRCSLSALSPPYLSCHRYRAESALHSPSPAPTQSARWVTFANDLPGRTYSSRVVLLLGPDRPLVAQSEQIKIQAQDHYTEPQRRIPILHQVLAGGKGAVRRPGNRLLGQAGPTRSGRTGENVVSDTLRNQGRKSVGCAQTNPAEG